MSASAYRVRSSTVRTDPTQAKGRGWREWFVTLYGRVVWAAAAWSLLRLVFPHARALERVDDLFALVNVPAGNSLFAAVGLFLVGSAVRRRMRAAWWLLLIVQVVAASYLLYVLTETITYQESLPSVTAFALTSTAINAVATVALVALLLATRQVFSAALPVGRRPQALTVLLVGVAASLAISVVLTFMAPETLHGTGHKVMWAVRAVFDVLPDHTDLAWGRYEHGHWWSASLVAQLAGLAVIAAVLVFIQPRRGANLLSAQDELDLRRLLLATEGPHDSLGYFATRRDKAAVFTPRRDAAVTYRVVANVSLASADPIGPRTRWPAAIDAWLQDARAHGWYPAVLAAGEAAAKCYVEAGLHALPMGDEAIIHTDGFTLRGPAMASVRRAVRRIGRLGYAISLHQHNELTAEQLAELAERADGWRTDQTERGFSMALGRLGDPLDGDSVVVLAHDSAGRLRGFLSLVPWGSSDLSLDLMRRDPHSDNGLMEAMVVSLVQLSREQLGVRQISLNFAMFRGIFSAAERVGAGPLVRTANSLMLVASRYWQIESLYRSNARYRPEWRTRYVCYDSPLSLTRVGIAVAAAEGFLPLLGGREVGPRESDTVEVAGTRMPLREALEHQQVDVRATVTVRDRLSDQQRARLASMELLRQRGMDPYPVDVPRTTGIGELRACPPDMARGSRTGGGVSVVGRVRAIRDFGGLVFVVLQEEHHTIQAMLSREALGPALHGLARGCLDLGDVVSVTGSVVVSDSGELSVAATRWQLAAKCLTPIPKLRPASAAPVPAARRRHVELITSSDAATLLELRSTAVRRLRDSLVERGFVEVETPMLQAVHGGANARPFVTHANALDLPFYLRIAPELHLKRLAVGGMQAVFEVNRNFRNEGIDDSHNPEFTALEAYRAFTDYHDMRELAEQLVREVAIAMYGAPVARRRCTDGSTVDVDLAGPWPVVAVHDAISTACGAPVDSGTPLHELIRLCRAHAVPLGRNPTVASVTTELYEHLVEAVTAGPTFYTDFPVEASPLARAHRCDPRLAERWDLVAFGHEIGTAYSELTDPVEQRRRLVAQSRRRAGGDPEAMAVDEEFLAALGVGMPPTGGLGIGIERLLMLLTGAPIRSLLAFPLTGRASVGV